MSHSQSDAITFRCKASTCMSHCKGKILTSIKAKHLYVLLDQQNPNLSMKAKHVYAPFVKQKPHFPMKASHLYAKPEKQQPLVSTKSERLQVPFENPNMFRESDVLNTSYSRTAKSSLSMKANTHRCAIVEAQTSLVCERSTNLHSPFKQQHPNLPMKANHIHFLFELQRPHFPMKAKTLTGSIRKTQLFFSMSATRSHSKNKIRTCPYKQHSLHI